MNIPLRILGMLLVVVILPLQIAISVLQIINGSLKTIVLIYEGKTVEEIQHQLVAEQLGKINKSLGSKNDSD